MRIAVIGAETALGKRIAAECTLRGFTVAPLPPQPEALTPERLGAFDAVVNAVTTEVDAALLAHLTTVLGALPSVRLLAVGGADTLWLDETRTRRVGTPAPEVSAALAALAQSGADWTLFSPAADFVPDGPRSGKPILGRDVRLLDPAGRPRLT